MTKTSLLKKFDSINSSRPLLVGTLTGSSPVSVQIKNAVQAAIDILECRMDTFPSLYQTGFFFMSNHLLSIRKMWKKPILLTLRAAADGGWSPPRTKPLSEKQRLALLLPCLKFIDLVDIEIRQPLLVRGIQGPVVIHSYHDFKSAGKWADIRRCAALSRKMGGDYFKLAARIQSDEDLARFFVNADELPNKRKIMIGMGKKGEISRYAGYSLGSRITYGHLGAPAAPGQPAAMDLRAGLDKLYGR